MGTGDPMEGCSVCADDTGTEDNPLVYCDGKGCNVCVHKACYGIRCIPKGDWFCAKCVYLRQNPPGPGEPTAGSATAAADSADSTAHRARVVNCQLCPSKEGALKPTSDGKWAHVVCALYIREAQFKDTEVMEPIVTSGIPKDRFQQTCFICLEETTDADAHSGACSICEKSGCRKAFHVTCAQRKGLLCEINRKNNKLQVLYSGFCAEHIPSLEAGIVEGSRFRKVPPYPRIALPSHCERSSSSSGYSTPNQPEKSPLAQLTAESQTQPAVAVAGADAENQRSSSIKSTASVGSSSTTESADSGIHSSSVVEGERVPGTTVGTVHQQPTEELRQIRKPPKKAFAARMDGAGIAAPTPAAPLASAPMTSSFLSQVPPADTARYYASNPFAAPHEMPTPFLVDPPRPPSGQTSLPVQMVKQQQENARMSPYLPSKGMVGMPSDRPTPPPLRKRALSPSILDNETLTISSLIERTIERATTNAATLPPVMLPFTSGVRAFQEDVTASHNNHAGVGKNEPVLKKPKKAPKESKVDPRRSGNTATIKDLLASSNLSPQNNQSPSDGTVSGAHVKASTPKPKQPTSSVSGLSFAMDAERTSASHSDSPFARDRVVSPKSAVVARQQDDRHRNNNVPSEVASVPERSAASLAGSVGKSKRKVQEDRGRAPAKATLQSTVSYAPAFGNGSSARSAVPPLNREDHASKKLNGYVNGNNDMADEDVDSPAGAQAFDSFMMALSTFGMSAAHQSALNSHPTAATTLDGFFRMQKELNTLKQKVGELEGLKAFYLTQVQSLRSLASKHQADGTYPPMVSPTMPEEVARLLSVLNGDSTSDPEQTGQHRNNHHHPSSSKNPPEHASSDGLLARLHEPSAPTSRDSSQRSSRPESRVPAGGPVFSAPPGGRESTSAAHHNLGQSPSSTPKPPSRSRGPTAGRDPPDRERDYVNGSTGYSASSASARRGQYSHLDHMDGVASGVISTPTAVVSTPQLINMPNMAGAPFLLQNPQLYSMIDPRMFGMMQGQAGFFPPAAYAQGMAGFMPSANPADYSGLGRMHTPTSMSGRYQMDEGNSSGSASQHASMKREYEMSRDS